MNASSTTSPWIRPLLFTIAGFCVAGAIFRTYILVRGGSGPDQDALLFLVAAVVAVLADSITKFSFAGLEFERLKQKVDEIADVAMTQGAPVRPGPAANSTASAQPPASGAQREAAREESTFDAHAREIESAVYSGDLSWEGDPVAEQRPAPSSEGGAKLEADVTPSKSKARVFKVDIRCLVPRGMLGKTKPRVAFYLHHTFPNRVRVLPVEGSVARLSLWTMGTFTVGALLPNGTWLTLDLAQANVSALSAEQLWQFRNG